MNARILFTAILALTIAQSKEAFSLSKAEKPQIESGFNLLYQLKFEDARRQFADWQQIDPKDPLGYVAMAAGYLFEEFHAQHVLTSEFFLNDESLLGGIRGKPDENRKMNFAAANQKGRDLALTRLNADPRDADSLFSLAISAGMQADYTAIIEKRQLESLSWIRKADGYAKRLLKLQPEDGDALFSLGAANYIIGSLPKYKRFFLWFGRIHGDKDLGMEQLKIAAEEGHYLKPLAEIFLALAAIREGREDIARTQLMELEAHFPENPLFRAELARLTRASR